MKTALVTGASSGIGRALAIELAAGGAHVAIAGRREPELQEVARAIEQRGGRALVVPLDVTNTAAVEEAVRRVDRDLGSLDLVIANAGTSRQVRAPLLTVKEALDIVDVNTRGAIATLVAAIPVMVAQQKGHLVAVTSLAGRRGLPGYGAYSATKAAVSTFLETLRVELAPIGIHVTDVQPGFVDTPLARKGQHPKPFMWTADRAARHIVRKLARKPAVIAFPAGTTALMQLATALPRFVYDPIIRALS
jgi:NAD(P)-dependent dehydrogenase (short-subunit alcohol dehydrogenase family)